jgi:methyltransferase (TIGR00027 family)
LDKNLNTGSISWTEEKTEEKSRTKIRRKTNFSRGRSEAELLREGRASLTAQRVAFRRAAHQVLDRPRLLEDPLALAIVGREAARTLATGGMDGGAAGRNLRAFVVVRSRFAEDELARAVERGVRQYVVLGAGLDTFAYRNPYPELRVFEVDHPATQEWKRERLETEGITVPESVTYAPVNFERQTVDEGLRLAGFQADAAAFFSWLGVTPYLKPETVLATFRRIIGMSSENGVAFDYAVPRSSLGLVSRMAFDVLARRVAAAGEPFRGFFEPAELAGELRGMGFRHVEDLGGEQINKRYFAGRTDGLRVRGGMGRLMSARG